MLAEFKRDFGPNRFMLAPIVIYQPAKLEPSWNIRVYYPVFVFVFPPLLYEIRSGAVGKGIYRFCFPSTRAFSHAINPISSKRRGVSVRHFTGVRLLSPARIMRRILIKPIIFRSGSLSIVFEGEISLFSEGNEKRPKTRCKRVIRELQSRDKIQFISYNFFSEFSFIGIIF